MSKTLEKEWIELWGEPNEKATKQAREILDKAGVPYTFTPRESRYGLCIMTQASGLYSPIGLDAICRFAAGYARAHSNQETHPNKL